MASRRASALALFVAAAALLAGCGGGGKSTAPPSTASVSAPPATAPAPATTAAQPSPGAGALQAEANSAATGDIPDNQVFLTYRDAAAGWSMKYPEGWAQKGARARLSFRDKNNVVRVVVLRGEPATAASVRRELGSLEGVHLQSGPTTFTVDGVHAFKVVYTTESAPNPVTGKRVTLTVDRYYVPRGRKEAIVDLGTPVGVDNVDAYRLMIESFRWR